MSTMANAPTAVWVTGHRIDLPPESAYLSIRRLSLIATGEDVEGSCRMLG